MTRWPSGTLCSPGCTAACVVPAMARSGGTELRERNLAGLKGDVVEVGAGDGANFAHYPDEVERILAVEPEPYLRERASAHSDERVELRDAMAHELPMADGEADAVVFSFVLCSVDQDAALPRPTGCCGPGASCASSSTCRPTSRERLRKVQRVLDATVWPRLFGGCHCGRDTVGRDLAGRVHRHRAGPIHLPRGLPRARNGRGPRPRGG